MHTPMDIMLTPKIDKSGHGNLGRHSRILGRNPGENDYSSELHVNVGSAMIHSYSMVK